MKEKLIEIIGRNILNGESSASTVVRLAKTINYLVIQLNILKNSIKDEDEKYCIESVLKNAESFLDDK